MRKNQPFDYFCADLERDMESLKECKVHLLKAISLAKTLSNIGCDRFDKNMISNIITNAEFAITSAELVYKYIVNREIRAANVKNERLKEHRIKEFERLKEHRIKEFENVTPSWLDTLGDVQS